MGNLLRDYQMDAVNRMSNGCILHGGTGSGKSITGLYYYFKENGGSFVNDEYIPMEDPEDLYIITTPKKRDSAEWNCELAYYRMGTKLPSYPEDQIYDNKVVVDSWNNIKKYTEVKNSFFIFDEDRVCGSGAWVKCFYKIAKNNHWIILSATPGDTWMDYVPVFVANGFFKNKSEFLRNHVKFSPYTKYPKIERYYDTERLIRLRDRILVDMTFARHTRQHHIDVKTSYDKRKYEKVMKTRWNPYTNEPINQAGEMCSVLRRIVNEDESRVVALMELLDNIDRAIIFYNFNYERDMLLHLLSSDDSVDGNPYVDYEVAEWSGHAHQPMPKADRWLYLVQYTAGCEGWNCITADTVIFFSQNYSYKVLEQACGRIDRMNTPFTDLYFYHLKSDSGIDRAISRAIKNKKLFNEARYIQMK